MGHRREPSHPVTTNGLLSIAYESKGASEAVGKEWDTLDLSTRHMTQMPDEVVEVIKDQIARLALGHNSLSTFSLAIASMTRLRYLNIRSNQFREFPLVLCQCPSLEILDVSRNRLKSLPRDFGNLMSLKVLSISKNKIQMLPTYIGNMTSLKILKIDHNPIVFPGKDITSFEGGEAGMDQWLENLKAYLRTHVHQEDGDDHITTDDDGAETDYMSYGRSVRRAPSFSGGSSKKLVSKSMDVPPEVPPIAHVFTKPAPPLPSKASNRAQFLNAPKLGPPQNGAAPMERSRSNSETGTPEHQRLAKRMGMPPRARTGLGTVLEGSASKHHSRGFSHDSMIDSGNFEGHPNAISEQNSGAYFRRLSHLPQSARASMGSVHVIEAVRGFMFSFSQIHQAVRQYITFCSEPALASAVSRVLYSANVHIGTLVAALEAHENEGDDANPGNVINAVRVCVGAFRHVVGTLLKHLHPLMERADARYSRTLLLLLTGAAAEIQNSWSILRPAMPAFSGTITQPIPHTPVTATPMSRTASPALNRLKSPSTASLTASIAANIAGSVMPGKGHDPFQPAPTATGQTIPETSVTETDEQLFEKISTATAAAQSVLALIGQAVAEDSISTAQNPQTPGATAPATSSKLRELSMMSVGAGEVTRRLSHRLAFVREGGDAFERHKFWEDTNAFVKAVISIAALAKTVSIEFPFPKSVLSGLAAVTRSTKELTILLSVSSFRSVEGSAQLNQAPPTTTTVPMITTTQPSPLSAALGPAAQAVLPSPAAFSNTSSVLTGGPPPGMVNRFDVALGQALRNGSVTSQSTLDLREVALKAASDSGTLPSPSRE
ncbi:hypothetical protein SAICODRAFT_92456 [Saitoella complicata NRRL Y-17804]|uniref:Disease resistance R13L4/SHOC-2-like LRR domain-containing protein n=1 Tax=Saitoella complicata (strain BCRC 22490 / CBS 7301 / JCM 7358 / NBRC 10748 / NRRL Y-17804) TaxID=698492 RepID=A0A0E9NFB4_SAICN|nr:uncharacterized protein SAICODRAFT_92456 [Saitoella complicata NRRL Y-17804]ODQ52843.1 hypothetical protein SAICODRAFT_92456 [Saitoella complicata NRRL Y-17804]GAO48534.1 hypothetical protein G7K_2707-t1 [Saitoella complicata NRRL Y-17804]